MLEGPRRKRKGGGATRPAGPPLPEYEGAEQHRPGFYCPEIADVRAVWFHRAATLNCHADDATVAMEAGPHAAFVLLRKMPKISIILEQMLD